MSKAHGDSSSRCVNRSTSTKHFREVRTHDVSRVVSFNLVREVANAHVRCHIFAVQLVATVYHACVPLVGWVEVEWIPVVGARECLVHPLATANDAALPFVLPVRVAPAVCGGRRRRRLGGVPLIKTVHAWVGHWPLGVGIPGFGRRSRFTLVKEVTKVPPAPRG